MDVGRDMKAARAERTRKAEQIVSRLLSGSTRRPLTLSIGDDAVEVEMRLITGRQSLQALADARGLLQALGLEEHDEARFRCESIASLSYAVVVPGTDERVFVDADALQNTLEEPQLAKLLLAYKELTEESDIDFNAPILRKEVEAALAKKDWTELRRIASQLRSRSLLTMVELLLTSLEGKS